MALRIKRASEGNVWAYKDEKDKELVLGSILYLGKDDNGERYYEIPKPKEEIVIDNTKDEQ